MQNPIQKRIMQVLIILMIQSVTLFVSAGTVYWKWAWIYILLNLILVIFNYFYLPKDIIKERGKGGQKIKPWDKTLNMINGVPTVMLYVTCGLQYRYHWPPDLSLPIKIIGLVVFVTGFFIFSWSMRVNRFFSTMVQIQDNRNHSVVTIGPYKIVRHPGYVGYILISLATPLILGTIWGLIFSIITTILFIIRTVLEDQCLSHELPGYSEYAKEVRFRIIPGIF
jgi:protein-S-isoprenylcysteine O-methyltransferase Ste14